MIISVNQACLNPSLVAGQIILSISLARCGFRGGYMEVVGMEEEVKFQLKKMISASLCSCTTGQVGVRKMSPDTIYQKVMFSRGGIVPC